MKQDDFILTMQALGMNQTELARALGMSATTIGYYCHGRYNCPYVIPHVVELAMMALWHRLEMPLPLLEHWVKSPIPPSPTTISGVLSPIISRYPPVTS